jgi:hypothetical protein
MSGSGMVVLKRRLCGRSPPGRRLSWNAEVIPVHIKGGEARHPTLENRGPEATQPWSPTLIPSGVRERGDFPKRWALHTAELAQPIMPAPLLCLPSSSASVPLWCQKTCIWGEGTRLSATRECRRHPHDLICTFRKAMPVGTEAKMVCDD